MKMFNRKLSYSERIRWRVRGLWLLLLLMLVYMVVIGELGLGDSRMMTSFAEQFSRICFFGGMIWVICKIHQNQKLLQNQYLLKEKKKEEQDERNQYLHDKSGGMVWDILLICLLFITLTASLSNMAAFYTSFAILCLMVLLKAIFSFAYRRCE
ncbi:MAG: hypothetical protein IKK75_14090 [Clostridia bacterium]|nr:hypothetical protein [Clostridia bacterium]